MLLCGSFFALGALLIGRLVAMAFATFGLFSALCLFFARRLIANGFTAFCSLNAAFCAFLAAFRLNGMMMLVAFVSGNRLRSFDCFLPGLYNLSFSCFDVNHLLHCNVWNGYIALFFAARFFVCVFRAGLVAFCFLVTSRLVAAFCLLVASGFAAFCSLDAALCTFLAAFRFLVAGLAAFCFLVACRLIALRLGFVTSLFFAAFMLAAAVLLQGYNHLVAIDKLGANYLLTINYISLGAD